MSKSNLDFNMQTTTTGQAPPCLQQKIDMENRATQEKVMKNDEYVFDKFNRQFDRINLIR